MIDFDEFDIDETQGFNPDNYITYVNSMFSRKEYVIRVNVDDISRFANVLYKNNYIWNNGDSPLHMDLYKILDNVCYIALIVINDRIGKRIINSNPSNSENVIDFE